MSAILNISDAIISFEGWQNHVIPEAHFYDKYDLLINQFSQLLEIIQKINNKKALFIKD